MNLIAVEKRNGIETVNARELHEFLESKRDFSNWIKGRVEDFEFIEGTDFTTFLAKSNGRPKKEYFITIEMAKELSMVERNAKGKQARKYFIECEKRLKPQLPQTFSEALLLASRQAKQIEEQNKLIEEQQPKVDFYNDVTDSKTAISMSQVAKVLDKKIGRNKLFEFLRDKKIIRKNNEPMQKFIDNGWFRVIEQKYNDSNGNIRISIKTLVFQKGVAGINKLLAKEVQNVKTNR